MIEQVCDHFRDDESMLGTLEDGTVECATCKAQFVPASKVCEHGQLRRQCPICEKDERIAEMERDRDAQKKCADAYFSALADIRGSLGLSEHDEHEFVTDSIKRLVSRLGACREAFQAISEDGWMYCGPEGPSDAQKKIIVAWEMLRDVEGTGPCDHNWVDPSNEVVQAGTHRLCTKCGLLKDTAVEASGPYKAAFDTMMGSPLETFPVVEERGPSISEAIFGKPYDDEISRKLWLDPAGETPAAVEEPVPTAVMDKLCGECEYPWGSGPPECNTCVRFVEKNGPTCPGCGVAEGFLHKDECPERDRIQRELIDSVNDGNSI